MLASEHFENLIKKMGGNPDHLPDHLLTSYLEALCECASAPEGVTTFTDSGNGDLALNGATGQTGKRFLKSMVFPGLTSKYINALHSGTFSDPYGIKVGGGASLIDAINALTEPGLYTVYQNRASTDAPDAAKAINSSLRGLACLSQINKHYAFIFMVDQASNFYIQYVQGDVGGGWKTMFQAEKAEQGLKSPNALTIKVGENTYVFDGSEAVTIEI